MTDAVTRTSGHLIPGSDDAEPTGRPGRPAVVIAVGGLSVAALATIAAIVLARGVRPLDRALDLLADDRRFDTAWEAANTIVAAAADTMKAAQACDAETSVDRVRCEALAESAAYLQTVAVILSSCPSDAVVPARATARRYLDTVAAAQDVDIPSRPVMPSLPKC